MNWVQFRCRAKGGLVNFMVVGCGRRLTVAEYDAEVLVAVFVRTTTGQMTVYAQEFAHSWSPLSLAAAILAVMIGKAIASTAAGIKNFCVDTAFKAIVLACITGALLAGYYLGPWKAAPRAK